jgi:GNAT superfamily N-acetyltransferase
MKFKGVLSGQFYYHLPDNGEETHSITAHTVNENGEPDLEKNIGHLVWGPPHEESSHIYDADEGEISSVNVDAAYRRQGVATKMYNIAKGLHRATQPNSKLPVKSMNLPENYFFLSPEHSPERSGEGTKWAKAVGGRLPEWNSCDNCGDTYGNLYEHEDGNIYCKNCI